ncbi:casein kinase 2 regulatory subunit [Phlyctochytrium planicorne]|nr:casein kinase 2 regulatory subunit [Phlyctochytrium planicorne]
MPPLEATILALTKVFSVSLEELKSSVKNIDQDLRSSVKSIHDNQKALDEKMNQFDKRLTLSLNTIIAILQKLNDGESSLMQRRKEDDIAVVRKDNGEAPFASVSIGTSEQENTRKDHVIIIDDDDENHCNEEPTTSVTVPDAMMQDNEKVVVEEIQVASSSQPQKNLPNLLVELNPMEFLTAVPTSLSKTPKFIQTRPLYSLSKRPISAQSSVRKPLRTITKSNPSLLRAEIFKAKPFLSKAAGRKSVQQQQPKMKKKAKGVMIREYLKEAPVEIGPVASGEFLSLSEGNDGFRKYKMNLSSPVRKKPKIKGLRKIYQVDLSLPGGTQSPTPLEIPQPTIMKESDSEAHLVKLPICIPPGYSSSVNPLQHPKPLKQNSSHESPEDIDARRGFDPEPPKVEMVWDEINLTHPPTTTHGSITLNFGSEPHSRTRHPSHGPRDDVEALLGHPSNRDRAQEVVYVDMDIESFREDPPAHPTPPHSNKLLHPISSHAQRGEIAPLLSHPSYIDNRPVRVSISNTNAGGSVTPPPVLVSAKKDQSPGGRWGGVVVGVSGDEVSFRAPASEPIVLGLRGKGAMSEVSSDSQESNAYWIEWFLSLKGNDLFCEVDAEYLLDRFNLTGLNAEVPHYAAAFDLMTDSMDEDLPDDTRMEIEASARHLYGMIHARFVLTNRGLQKMFEKPVLPVGLSDISGLKPVMLYCPRCEDVYNPPSRRHASIDGAYFGTTFPHLLIQVYPTLLPPHRSTITSGAGAVGNGGVSSSSTGSNATAHTVSAGGVVPVERYVPKIFGFRVHSVAREHRMQDEIREEQARRLRGLQLSEE